MAAAWGVVEDEVIKASEGREVRGGLRFMCKPRGRHSLETNELNRRTYNCSTLSRGIASITSERACVGAHAPLGAVLLVSLRASFLLFSSSGVIWSLTTQERRERLPTLVTY